jgi:hypothetical protein
MSDPTRYVTLVTYQRGCWGNGGHAYTASFQIPASQVHDQVGYWWAAHLTSWFIIW